MKTKNEKPELLYVNKENLRIQKVALIRAESDLNRLVNETERALNKLLSDEEKELVKNQGVKYVKEQIKTRYPFPNATEDFNLTALGIDLEKIDKYKAMNWAPYQFELDADGLYVANEYQESFKSVYYYADTPKKVKLLKLAKKIVKLSEEAALLNAFNGALSAQVSKGFNGIIKPDGDANKNNCKLKVNKEGVAFIR